MSDLFDLEFARKVKLIGERYNWDLSAFFEDLKKQPAAQPAAQEIEPCEIAKWPQPAEPLQSEQRAELWEVVAGSEADDWGIRIVGESQGQSVAQMMWEEDAKEVVELHNRAAEPRGAEPYPAVYDHAFELKPVEPSVPADGQPMASRQIVRAA